MEYGDVVVVVVGCVDKVVGCVDFDFGCMVVVGKGVW